MTGAPRDGADNRPKDPALRTYPGASADFKGTVAPDLTTTRARAASDAARVKARRGLDDVEPETPLLGRRDVAVTPWVVIAVGAAALAVAQLLRPDGGFSTPASGSIIVGSLCVSIGAGALAALQDTRWGVRLRGSLWVYLLGSALLLSGLTTIALLDRGLDTVAFTGTLLIASYLGLVFPPFWSRLSVGVLLVTMFAVQFVKPDADLRAAATLIALAGAAWATGVLARYASKHAGDQALILSRSDQLTATLNRRGFLDELGDHLRQAARQQEPFALLVIDLNGFKLINDNQGHAAGDELLAWVGTTVPGQLPADAAFGRMGGDEFAAALPGATALSAHITAQRIQEALAERIGASVGVAACPAEATANADPLMQLADAALYAAKADPTRRIQLRTMDADVAAINPMSLAGRRTAAFTFAQLRAAGGPPKEFLATLYRGPVITAGFWLIGAAGIIFMISSLIVPLPSVWLTALKVLGPPWALTIFALGLFYLPRSYPDSDPPLFAFGSSVVLVAGGVTVCALSSGSGAMNPITAAFFLKVLFDAAMADRRVSVPCFVVVVVSWAVLLILGPAAALWVAPYQFSLLVGAFLFGLIGRRAFAEAATTRLALANTDALTGLLNRSGFEASAAVPLAQAAAGHGTFALITFDLDNFKSINDTLGHAAGDELLRAVAAATSACLPKAHAIGRIGGDEFVAAVPASSLAGVRAIADVLDGQLQAVTGGSIGCAIYPEDGTTLGQLLQLADHRAYGVKKTRAGRAIGRDSFPCSL
jgi:diguanylate cyclase (GGDEF)-like protein